MSIGGGLRSWTRLAIIGLVPAAALLACHGEPPPGERSPLNLRWAWDSVALAGTPGDGPAGIILAPGTQVRVGPAAGGLRPVFVSDTLRGYAHDTMLHQTPLPSAEIAYRYAEALALRELSFPHTARFPPYDSASVSYHAGGIFMVSSTLSAKDGSGATHTVPWTVRLRRSRYLWEVDSVFVASRLNSENR